MNEFLGLLKQFKDNDKEFAVAIASEKRIRVKIQKITGDIVTLYDQDSDNRYDLHYTAVVICSLQK